MRSALLGVGLGLWVVACGSSSNGGANGPGANGDDGGAARVDAGSGGPADGGVDGTLPLADGGADAATDGSTYACATHPPIPGMKYWGGPILHKPKIVTVTFASLLDATSRGQLEAWGDAVTTSPWWDATMKGYCDGDGGCIGQGVSGGHVTLNETPAASYSDSQTSGARSIVKFFQDHVTAGTLPVPDEDTLYMVYFPSSVTLTLDTATSCSGFGAYHFAAQLTLPGDGGATVTAAYALMPDCGDAPVGDLINVASHELIEAATDAKSFGPDVRNQSWGYYMEDPAWGILFGGQEVADLCAGYQPPEYPAQQVTGIDMVRGWRHDIGACEAPCGPLVAGDTYFGAAPSQQVISLAVGEETVVDVTAFSSVAQADWTVTPIEPGDSPMFGITGYGGHIQFTWDGVAPVDGGAGSVTVNNGAVNKLHVKLLSSPPEDQNYPDQSGAHYKHAFAVMSSSTANGHHSWPFTVREKP
jgi:hypothetical protein